jgi:hypothetical protein
LYVAEVILLGWTPTSGGVLHEHWLQVDAHRTRATLGQHSAEPTLTAAEVDDALGLHVTDDAEHPFVEEPLSSVVSVLLASGDPLGCERIPFAGEVLIVHQPSR